MRIAIAVAVALSGCWRGEAPDEKAPHPPEPTTARAPCATTREHGALVGVVKGSINGPLPGVTIVVMSPALAGSHTETVITDENGAFRLADLPSGIYDVSFYYAELVAKRRGCVRARIDTKIEETLVEPSP